MNDYINFSEKDFMTDKIDVFIQNVNTSLAKLEKVLLIGNGVPALTDRMARVEEDIEKLVSASKESGDNIKELSKAISELKTVVSNHIKDEKLHSPLGLFIRKDVILYGVVAWILIYTVIPKTIDLWAMISKILGL